jgi:uncharacterized protein (TIGR02598 family)
LVSAFEITPGGCSGFTLVEVVLALGLCSFAIVSLLSLMPVSLNTAREAMDMARGSKAAQQVAAELSQSQFSNLTALSGSSLERTFDYDGNPTSDAKDIYFTVTASVTNSTLLPGAADSSASLARVCLEVKTPRQVLPGKTAVTISDMGY